VQGELLKGMQFRKPDISFDGDYVLDLGGVPVLMTSVGATAHGGRNTVFLVEGDRVLFSGDVVMSAFPAVNPRVNHDPRRTLDQPRSLAASQLSPAPCTGPLFLCPVPIWAKAYLRAASTSRARARPPD
jgi:glyoxylase-like metal-dependent hydrolase (beta-lactamase superfamily II)